MSTESLSTEAVGRYRLAYVGTWLAATAAYVLALVAGEVLLGVAAFGVGALLAVGLQWRRPVRFDERDAAVIETASARTVQVVGLVSGVGFPSLAAAGALGYYEWTPFAAGVASTVTALFALWALFLLVARGG